MVIYGILAEADIGKLFIAGIVPGILLVGAFHRRHRGTDGDRPGHRARRANVCHGGAAARAVAESGASSCCSS